MIPKTASNAQGYDYTIHIPKTVSESLSANLDGITGRLKVIQKQWRESLRQSKITKNKANTDAQQVKFKNGQLEKLSSYL